MRSGAFLLAAMAAFISWPTTEVYESGYEVAIVRLSGEWAWSPAMDTDNPDVGWMQRGCDDPDSTLFPNAYVETCYRPTSTIRIRGWQLNMSLRTNVGVALACMRIEYANGDLELLGCANCASSAGGCVSTVGQDFGDGFRTLGPGDEIGFRLDGYGTPCAGSAAAAWGPPRFCEAPIELQASMIVESP